MWRSKRNGVRVSKHFQDYRESRVKVMFFGKSYQLVQPLYKCRTKKVIFMSFNLKV